MLRLGSYPYIPTLSASESMDWLQKAAELGNVSAMRKMAAGLSYIRPREALEWLRRGARTDEGNIMLDLIRLLDEMGERAEAAEWIDRLLESCLFMVPWLAEWLEENGRADEAEACLRQAMTTGELTIAWRLSELLERTRGSSAAVEVWREAIESGALSGMSYISAKGVVRQINGANEVESASGWLRAAVDDGCPHSILILVELTDPADAEDMLRESITLGNYRAMPQFVNVLERKDRAGEAEAMLRTTVEAAPRLDAWSLLTELVERMGRTDEAKAMQRYGIEPGGQTAAPW
jgi:tetratricopeptide (TPR) repeat protein